MTYGHTPIFTKSKTPNHKTKTKNPSSGSDFSELTGAGRPSGSTDVHAVHVCTSADRSGRPGHLQCSLFVRVDRGGRPLSPNGQKFDRWRSTGPVDRQLSEILTDSNSSIFLTDFVGMSPQRISLAVLPCFSIPINRWSLQLD